MLERIYKEIARKDLSFGCKFSIYKWWRHKIYLWEYRWKEQLYHSHYKTYTSKKEVTTKWVIIGHPVMIGDVLYWIETYFKPNYKDQWSDAIVSNAKSHILTLRKDTRKPIDEQPIECIQYVFDLLPKDTNE